MAKCVVSQLLSRFGVRIIRRDPQLICPAIEKFGPHASILAPLARCPGSWPGVAGSRGTVAGLVKTSTVHRVVDWPITLAYSPRLHYDLAGDMTCERVA